MKITIALSFIWDFNFDMNINNLEFLLKTQLSKNGVKSALPDFWVRMNLTDMFSVWERIHNCNPGWKREKSSESSCLHNNISHHFQFHLILGVNPNRSDFKNSISSICTNCYFNFSHLSTLFSLINCSWYTFGHLMIVCINLIIQSWTFAYISGLAEHIRTFWA